MTGVLLAALAIGIPALVFALWPLLRRGGATTSFLPLPADGREQLLERKRRGAAHAARAAVEHDPAMSPTRTTPTCERARR